MISRFSIPRFNMTIVMLGVSALLGFVAILYLSPQPIADTNDYIAAMDILRGEPIPPEYVPKRFLTTLGGLSLVLLLTPLFGQAGAWLLVNFIFYVTLALASFFLFRTIFQSERVAFLGALFVIGNYAPLVFGLAFLMDAGGWAFYMLALWGVAEYATGGKNRAIILAAAAIGVGALFKEYALLGCVAIATVLIWRFFRDGFKVFPLMISTALIAISPTALVHAGVYNVFQYTYLDWAQYAKNSYVYSSRIFEYIKSILSLMSILLFPALLGAFLFIRSLIQKGKDTLDSPRTIALLAVILSGIPALLWGAVTQRVLFPLVIGAAALACVLFKRYENTWYFFLPLVVLYITIALHTDYLLHVVNLPF